MVYPDVIVSAAWSQLIGPLTSLKPSIPMAGHLSQAPSCLALKSLPLHRAHPLYARSLAQKNSLLDGMSSSRDRFPHPCLSSLNHAWLFTWELPIEGRNRDGKNRFC